MPRFKNSRHFKGFAFVEFGEAGSAEKAVSACRAGPIESLELKAMMKKRWLEIKEALKEKLLEPLAGEDVKHSRSESNDAPKATEKPVATPATEQKQQPQPQQQQQQQKKPKPAKSKRKHMHFADSDDDGDESPSTKRPRSD